MCMHLNTPLLLSGATVDQGDQCVPTTLSRVLTKDKWLPTFTADEHHQLVVANSVLKLVHHWANLSFSPRLGEVSWRTTLLRCYTLAKVHSYNRTGLQAPVHLWGPLTTGTESLQLSGSVSPTTQPVCTAHTMEVAGSYYH
jgi:hypothetical protein